MCPQYLAGPVTWTKLQAQDSSPPPSLTGIAWGTWGRAGQGRGGEGQASVFLYVLFVGGIAVALCVCFSNYQAQLSMALLWRGLSLFICSMSRHVRCAPAASVSVGRKLFPWPLLGPAPPAPSSTPLRGRRGRVSSFLGSMRVFVSQSACELCVCESEFGYWWLSETLPGGAPR